MYFFEDWIQVVKLYIKLGKPTGATIVRLGYSTKNALKRWHREYERDHDLPVSYVISRSKYSNEQKMVVVEHYLKQDRCLAATREAWDTMPQYTCSLKKTSRLFSLEMSVQMPYNEIYLRG